MIRGDIVIIRYKIINNDSFTPPSMNFLDPGEIFMFVDAHHPRHGFYRARVACPHRVLVYRDPPAAGRVKDGVVASGISGV